MNQKIKKYLTPANYWRTLRYRLNPSYKKSYSQRGEDLIVTSIFRSLGIEKPMYLDIGAYEPLRYSNTALLYENGSHGINVEPNPLQYKKFLAKRKRDVNLNIGIGDHNGELDFYVLLASLSTFSHEEAERLVKEEGLKITKTIRVPVRTVASVVDEHAGGVMPDFMSIDVEGLDEQILRSIDFTKYRPKVICAETISYSPRIGEGVKNTSLIEFLKEQRYNVFADTNINTIFVDIDLLPKQTAR